jgi:hypothetical protein
LPFESLSRTTIAEVLEPFAVIVVGEAAIVDVPADALPGIEAIEGDVPVIEPSVAVTVHDPTEAGVVNVTVATPLPSVDDESAEKEPPPQFFDQVAVWLGSATALPFESASCAVTVTLFPATGVSELEVTRNFAGAPGVNDTSAVSARVLPFRVAVTCAVPETSPDVSVAVYVPSLWFVTEPSVPRDVAGATVPPSAVTSFPFASFSWTVSVDALDPLATIEAVDGVIVDVAADALPGTLVNRAVVPWRVPSSAVTV